MKASKVIHVKKLILIAIAFMLMIPFSGVTVYASSGTISLSDPTVKVGDSVSVTVKVTATGSETIKTVNMNLTYDESALEFESSSEATGGNGEIQLSGEANSATKTYTLDFKALKSSTSSIIITDCEIIDSNDTEIEMSKIGSSTVTISASDSTNAKTTETNESDNQSEEATTEVSKIVTPPKKDVEVEIAGTSFTVCKIPQDMIPEGFEYIGYMYEDVAVDALQKDSIVLFYLNQSGEEAKVFYVYDTETGAFSVYAPVTASYSYTVVNLEENVTIPDGFTETEVSVGGVAVTAWQSDSNSEYYLLYLMNSEGSKELYLYDIVEKTVQRYYYSGTEDGQTDTDSYQEMYAELNENYNADMQSRMFIIYVFLVITVILIFVIINLIFRLVDKKHAALEDDEEEDEDIEFLYEDLEKKEKKKRKFLKKETTPKNQSKYEDEDDFEDDYEDSEEDYDDSDEFKVEIFDFQDK